MAAAAPEEPTHFDGVWNFCPIDPASPWRSLRSLISMEGSTSFSFAFRTPQDLALSSLVFHISGPQAGASEAAASTWHAFSPSPSRSASLNTHSAFPPVKALLALQCPACHLLWEVFLDASQSHARVCGFIPVPWWHLVRVFVRSPAALPHSQLAPAARCVLSVCPAGGQGLGGREGGGEGTERLRGCLREGCNVSAGELHVYSRGPVILHAARDRLEGPCSVGKCLAARELGAEQGPLSRLGAVPESSAAASAHTSPPPLPSPHPLALVLTHNPAPAGTY